MKIFGGMKIFVDIIYFIIYLFLFLFIYLLFFFFFFFFWGGGGVTTKLFGGERSFWGLFFFKGKVQNENNFEGVCYIT